nr:hypothetical protein BgiMline_028217 [Biomphalaria glabrata]
MSFMFDMLISLTVVAMTVTLTIIGQVEHVGHDVVTLTIVGQVEHVGHDVVTLTIAGQVEHGGHDGHFNNCWSS